MLREIEPERARPPRRRTPTARGVLREDARSARHGAPDWRGSRSSPPRRLGPPSANPAGPRHPSRCKRASAPPAGPADAADPQPTGLTPPTRASATEPADRQPVRPTPPAPRPSGRPHQPSALPAEPAGPRPVRPTPPALSPSGGTRRPQPAPRASRSRTHVPRGTGGPPWTRGRGPPRRRADTHRVRAELIGGSARHSPRIPPACRRARRSPRADGPDSTSGAGRRGARSAAARKPSRTADQPSPRGVPTGPRRSASSRRPPSAIHHTPPTVGDTTFLGRLRGPRETRVPRPRSSVEDTGDAWAAGRACAPAAPGTDAADGSAIGARTALAQFRRSTNIRHPFTAKQLPPDALRRDAAGRREAGPVRDRPLDGSCGSASQAQPAGFTTT